MGFVETFIKDHPVQKLEVDGVTGDYIVGGKGKIGFLIFPGGGQDALSCFDLIDNFEKQYKVIAINFAGFTCLSSFFEFVNQVLKKERIEQVIIYGLSIGGFFAQHYVMANPRKVFKIILSHTASTKSETIKKRVITPGKILYFFLPVIPIKLFKWVIRKFSGKIQSGHSNIKGLYEKYSTGENSQRRIEFGKRFWLVFLDRKYLKSFYKLGIEMLENEKNWDSKKLNELISKRMLIIKTDNDPLAQDDGIFKEYYPHAKVYIFKETGHLTPFVQFENMINVINQFLK